MTGPSHARRARRAGQAMIFLMALVVILAFVVLWNFDLHKIITVKLRSQHGGDAAALAAARWQGLSLNLIGNLNVLQAVAIADTLARGDGDFTAAAAIADLEARLCYSGPMMAFAAAQQAAKNNGLYANSAFTLDATTHAREVLDEYPDQFRIHPYTNAPSPPTCWDDYGAMIYAVAVDGVAAAPDNIRYYVDFSSPGHVLLNASFYDAVSSADWCWFYHSAYALLQTYRDYHDWPPLPMIREPEPVNAEYFGLGLRRVDRLENLPGQAALVRSGDLDELIALLGAEAGRSLTQEVARVDAGWYCYDPRTWRPWTDLIPEGFPFLGSVKAQADYVGADAVVRTEAVSGRLSPGSGGDAIVWSAAAKAFGYLDGPVPPHRYGLVLPAFREVKLIPVDTATGSSGGTRPGWAVHAYDHLPLYLADGLDGLSPGCWYCNQLRTWENEGFRAAGIAWLEQNSSLCRRSTGGGGPSIGSGGSRRGH